MPLLAQLNTLESSGLIRLAAVQPELEYLFRHALVQDAAYASLLKNDRRQLHLATCHALEKLYPDQTDELAATLAYHYEKAEDNERAAHYFQRAGDLARKRYANVEALAFYQSAIRLVTATNELNETQRSTLAKLYEDDGDLLEILGQHEAAKEHLARALNLLTTAEFLGQARLHRKRALIHVVQREMETAFQLYTEAELVLGKVPGAAADLWHREWLEIQLARNWLLYAVNQTEELQRSIERARPILEQYGTAVQQASFVKGQVILSQRVHRYLMLPDTMHDCEVGLAAARRSGDLRIIADAEFILGYAYVLSRNLSRGEAHLRACLQFVERAGDMVVETRCLTYLVVLYRMKGDRVAVQGLLERLRDAATTTQMKEYLTVVEAAKAWLAWQAGKPAEARELSQLALDHWHQLLPLNYPFQWQALWIRLAVALTQGQLADVLPFAQHLVAPEQQVMPVELDKHLKAGILAWEANQPETARQHLETAMQQAQAQGYL